MKQETKIIAGAKSWLIANKETEVAVTEEGGHMAPVTFFRDSKSPVKPYYIAPWCGEGLKIETPVLKHLRGDFFCMPFGGDSVVGKEKHTAHGEAATSVWKFQAVKTEKDVTTLELTMDTKVRPGRLTKQLSLADGESVIYISHILSGYTGKMCLGHHAILDVPLDEGSIRIATSPVKFGMTNPVIAGFFAGGEYYSLQPNKKFKSLEKVPTIWKDEPFKDCSVYPTKRGFIDLLQVYAKQGKEPGWVAAAVPSRGYLWFALKDSAVLPSTVMWTENYGRHQAPWSGRNCCIGIEDVMSYFADGLKNSAAKNRLNEAGIPTCHELSKKSPLSVRYIEGAVRIPKNFDKVSNVSFGKNCVTFTSKSGVSVEAKVRYGFLKDGNL